MARNDTATFSTEGEILSHCQGIKVVDYSRARGDILLDAGNLEPAIARTAMNNASNRYGLRFAVFSSKDGLSVLWKGKKLPFAGKIELKL